MCCFFSSFHFRNWSKPKTSVAVLKRNALLFKTHLLNVATATLVRNASNNQPDPKGRKKKSGPSSHIVITHQMSNEKNVNQNEKKIVYIFTESTWECYDNRKSCLLNSCQGPTWHELLLVTIIISLRILFHPLIDCRQDIIDNWLTINIFHK